MSIFDKHFELNTKSVLQKFKRSDIVLQALLVGIISGLLAVLFRLAITNLDSLLFNTASTMDLGQKLLIFPAITALGGLLAGLLIYNFAPESAGSGIPEVKYFLSKFNHKLRSRAIATKFLAGIVGIGSGISLGREGPSVQLGAGAGALVAKWFKLKGFKQKSLVASGAGAAIAATFNAPIAATIFVLEELVHVFKSSLLFPLIIATVTASVLARFLLGNNYAFIIPDIAIQADYQNIPVYIVLGIVAGLIGVAFTGNIMFNIKYFEQLKIPQYLKPAIAGLLTGLLGVFLPFIFGPGNQAISELLDGKFALLLVLVILICKFFITSLCFGSGAAGGLFLPTIMLGSFVGYFVGTLSNVLFHLNIDPTIVALVGMGAFLSAVVRTPLTAVVIVFELTGDYNHILPIMLSAAIADLIADKMHSPSIYALLMLKRDQKTKQERASKEFKEEQLVSEAL